MTTAVKQDLIDKHGMKFLRSTRYNEIWKGDNMVMIWNRTNGSIKIKPDCNEYYDNDKEIKESVLSY